MADNPLQPYLEYLTLERGMSPRTVEAYGREAARRGWLVVLPHFRGPNTTSNPTPTQAGGSLLAQHDIDESVQKDNLYFYLHNSFGLGAIID